VLTVLLLEPVEDLVYGTPAPEEAAYNAAAYAAAYAEAYESYECKHHPNHFSLSARQRADFCVSDDATPGYSYVY
jgi:hypothetical protein